MSESVGETPEPYVLRQHPDEADPLDLWIQSEDPPSEVKAAVVGWLRQLLLDPGKVKAHVRPALGLPRYTALVPDTDIAVTFYIMKSPPYEQSRRGVWLLRVETLPDGLD